MQLAAVCCCRCLTTRCAAISGRCWRLSKRSKASLTRRQLRAFGPLFRHAETGICPMCRALCGVLLVCYSLTDTWSPVDACEDAPRPRYGWRRGPKLQKFDRKLLARLHPVITACPARSPFLQSHLLMSRLVVSLRSARRAGRQERAGGELLAQPAAAHSLSEAG